MKVAKIKNIDGNVIPFDTTINAIPELEEKIQTIVSLIQERDGDFSLEYTTREEILSFDTDTYGYITIDSVMDLISVINSILEELKKDVFEV